MLLSLHKLSDQLIGRHAGWYGVAGSTKKELELCILLSLPGFLISRSHFLSFAAI
jgi:hypothetical protein